MLIVVPLVAFAVAWVYTVGTNYLTLIPWRRSAAQHWTERARILYPARAAASGNVWLVSFNCALAGWICFTLSPPMMGATFVGAFIGSVLGSYRFDRELFPAFGFRLWTRYVTVSLALRIGAWMVLLVFLIFMPSDFGWVALAFGSMAAGLLLAMHLGLWRWLMVRFGLLAPPPEKLTEIVRRASARCGIPYRAVWLLQSPVGYAAALPATGDLIFSEGMLLAQSPEEIDSICAHELAHLNESRGIVFLRVGISLWIVPFIFVKPMAQTFGATGLFCLVLAVALPLWFARGLSRRMEVRADGVAKEHQLETGIYARALERLYECNQIPAVMPSNRLAHPDLYDRLLAAGVAPAYPRPAKPDGKSWNYGLMIVVMYLLLAGALAKCLHQ